MLTSMRAARHLSVGLATGLLAAVLAACAADGPAKQILGSPLTPNERARHAYALLEQGRRAEAAQFLNEGILRDPASSTLHASRAAMYQIESLRGDRDASRSAEAGFRIAIEKDPGNGFALRQYVHILLAQERHAEVVQVLAAHLAAFPDDTSSLQDLGAAAYLSGDPFLAAGALKVARSLGPLPRSSLALYAIAAAAITQYEIADNVLEELRQQDAGSSQYQNAVSRVGDWRRAATVSQSLGGPEPRATVRQGLQVAQEAVADDEAGESDAAAPAALALAPGAARGRPCATTPSAATSSEPQGSTIGSLFGGGSGSSDNQSRKVQPLPALVGPDQGEPVPRMIALDAVFIRSEDVIGKAYGVNLLSLLQANFSLVRDSISGGANPGVILTRRFSLNLPTNLAYSLNIANSFYNRAEILARPTLTTLDCQPATFFSGQEVSVVSAGTAFSGGSLIEKPIGVGLAVTPTILDDQVVLLNVSLSRTFLEVANNLAPSLNQTLQTSSTLLTTSVALKFGETLMVSGIVSTDRLRNREGIPGLRELPLIQYFTSTRLDLDAEKSILVLLTPRRPNYTQDGRQELADRKGDSAEVKRLKQFLRFQFTPPDNTTSAMAHLAQNRYFRYLRRGDAVGEPWTEYRSIEGQMRILKEFLWY